MFKGTVLSAKGDAFKKEIVVDLEILKEGKAVELRKLGFPSDIKKDDLTVELEKFMDTYNADAKLKAESQAQEKAEKEMNKVINSVEGLKI